MGWRQRVKKPVAVPRQHNFLTLAIDPATLHGLSKLVFEVAKLWARGNSTPAPTPTPPPTPTPTQQIIPGGSLSVSYGTISVTSDRQLVWSDGRTRTLKGTIIAEIFVANDIVYGICTDGNCYQHLGNFTGNWESLSLAEYQTLRAAALKIITPAVVVQG
jgi:hypothetical protein